MSDNVKPGSTRFLIPQRSAFSVPNLAKDNKLH